MISSYRILRTLLAALGLAGAASGYYHFVHYSSNGGPYLAIPEKFDLSAIPEKSVNYHISTDGPEVFAEYDNFEKVVSQLRSAAAAWNGIETSDLRLRFGGLGVSPEDAATPAIDIVFDDLPPGVNGYGGPNSRNGIASGSTGDFIPIQRSVVVLSRDLAKRPSWSEAFYLTAVHELGHALGLQHSFTSGAMSTEITRATTKIRPISPDDAAGISILYPTADFRKQLGSISGVIVADDGTPIPMASVVAINPGGDAVGALTHPDGTFTIEGLPPGQYFLYAHPLPPALPSESTPGNVVLPVDSSNRAVDGSFQFNASFYPGRGAAMRSLTVVAGGAVNGLSLEVARRDTAPAIHSIQTYSFPAQQAVKPAHIYTYGLRNLVVLTGYGLIEQSKPVPDLTVSVLGGSLAVTGVKPYSQAPASYLQLDTQFGPFAVPGPRHLLFTRGDDTYLLPYGLRIAGSSPPSIDAVLGQNDNGDYRVTGSGFNANTIIGFDGIFAPARTVNNAGTEISVTLPVVSPGQQLHLAAFNPDGQSSLFLQEALRYSAEGRFDASPNSGAESFSLPAGTESLIEIGGGYYNDASSVSLGFGTPDAVVTRTWVVSPTRILANVWISPGARTNSWFNLTNLNGLVLSTRPNALRIESGSKPWLSTVSPQGVTIGAANALILHNSFDQLTPNDVKVTVEGQDAVVTAVDGATVYFIAPAGLTAGAGVLRAQIAGTDTLPLAVSLLPAPMGVASIWTETGIQITPSRPAQAGEKLIIVISNVPASTEKAVAASPAVSVKLGETAYGPTAVRVVDGLMQIRFTPSASSSANPILTVTIGSFVTEPVSLAFGN